MAKFLFLIFGLVLGIGLSKITTSSFAKKDVQVTKETDRQMLPQEVTRVEQVISNCEEEISKAKFSLLYKTLEIDSNSLIKGANGIPFNDPRMFVEVMNGFARGDLCVEYVKDGQTSTSCIQRKIKTLEVADSKNNFPDQTSKSFRVESTRTIDRDVAIQTTDEDSILSDLLAKKGLIPVRNPQTGDITGYTKVTK